MSQKVLAQNAENGSDVCTLYRPFIFVLIYLQDDGSYDIVEKHHERNRAPWPPNPEQLERIRSRQHGEMDMDNNGDGERSTPEDNNEPKSRAKRHSQMPYTGQTDDPKKLGFYPPQWWDVLEGGQVKFFRAAK
jgi:hypothetical protein